jgi:hypothetical protein
MSDQLRSVTSPGAVYSNERLQHGHWLSKPRTGAMNAEGCGSVMIALNASGVLWA